MAASSNPILQTKEVRDPTLFCTAFKRPRFYMFTRFEPEYVTLHYSLENMFLTPHRFLFAVELLRSPYSFQRYERQHRPRRPQ